MLIQQASPKGHLQITCLVYIILIRAHRTVIIRHYFVLSTVVTV